MISSGLRFTGCQSMNEWGGLTFTGGCTDLQRSRDARDPLIALGFVHCGLMESEV